MCVCVLIVCVCLVFNVVELFEMLDFCRSGVYRRLEEVIADTGRELAGLMLAKAGSSPGSQFFPPLFVAADSIETACLHLMNRMCRLLR